MLSRQIHFSDDADAKLTVFHQVFAMFRGAVGSAGVAARGDLGNNVLPDAANVGRRLCAGLCDARDGIDRERTMSAAERPLMNVDEAIRRRRSVRGFLPREVSEATLREVFMLAQCAPSNCNVQPWTPHVVSGEKLTRLREALVAAGMRDEPDWPADGKFTGIYRERQVGAAQALYGAMGVARSDTVGRRLAYIRNHAFFDAPHAVFIFMPEPFDTREATDIGMYAQTLMLALTARGIGSCAQGALGLFPDIVREQLEIPGNSKLLFGISFGYEDHGVKANAARVDRARIDDVVRFHR